MSANTQIPDWKLERYLLRELPNDELEKLDLLIDGDTDLQARLQALERSNADIKSSYSTGWMRQRIMSKAGMIPTQNKHTSFRWIWPVIPALGLLLVMVIVPDFIIDPEEKIGPSKTRTKGIEPTIQIFRKTDSGSERLTEGEIVQENDLLQIAYRSNGLPYGIIFSVDGRGAMTLHLPYSGDRSEQLEQGETVPLAFSYELDDAPNWERFYFITSENPFNVNEILDSVKARDLQGALSPGDSLEISNTLNQMTILLRKETTDE